MPHKHPAAEKKTGIFRQILYQERAPIFTGTSMLASLLTLELMLLTYARWHTNLGFGALAVPFFYGFVALAGAVINTAVGCVAAARGECYGGRIALAGTAACILAALVFVRLTLR